MHAKITWILVADGKRATVYHHDGPGKGLQVVPEMGGEHTEVRSHDMVTDNLGRSQGRAGAHGGATMTPRSDPHELEEQRFTEGVAATLNHAAQEKRFERLILVAPPRTLGQLRHSLSGPATKLVTAELHKDLTKGSLADLATHLQEHLAM